MQYVVQAGDTLFAIAQRFGTTVDAIVRANNIQDPNNIFVGQVLTIPTGAAQPTPKPPSPPSPPSTGACPELRLGSRGSAVIRLQNLLRNAGFNPGPADGVFGRRTENAVRAFQARQRLTVTGVVNIATWRALGENCGITPPPTPPTPPTPPGPPQEFHCPILRLGAVGPAVRFLQRLLKEKGFYNGVVDGDFGGRTERAVRQFQRQQGLAVTGVVNEATWRALGANCALEPQPPSGTPIATAVGRGLRHILFTNKRVYENGENVRISLVKTNITSDEINLRYNTSQVIEVTITDSSGNVVWVLSQNRQFAQFSRLITIFPGGTQLLTENWNQLNNAGRPAPPGTYRIRVENLATDVSLTVQIEIR